MDNHGRELAKRKNDGFLIETGEEKSGGGGGQKVSDHLVTPQNDTAVTC